MDGWIKLHRKFLDWQWYGNPTVKSVFLHLLLSANIENKMWQGIEIKRGQVVASLEKISSATGLTVRQVRTALKQLETTQSLTRKAYSKYTVFTILNYDEYQETTQSLTSKRQASDKQTTNKRQANDNNIRNKERKEREEGKELLPPLPPEGNGSADGFEEFWQAYPKKTAKQAALKAWNKLKPNAELRQVILDALERQTQSVQWQKDGGQFIPYPATWLNGRRWEDGFEQFPKPPPKQEFDPNDPYKNWG
ncbi:MAG: hypothetical protein NC253_13435 [Ruminococcus sp.]|nr:hypothetical protein [Ruminococcus sp.]MCM1381372.1 hypothetical protein [Muribaculaceae bacterium]MCM1480284.1 hypothetical protein [Muribaculaceae bacterium]